MACLNMGFNVMANKIAGSESEFVELCHKTYPRYHGWLTSQKNISYASYNAACFLSNYDIFALQEVNEQYREIFFQAIKIQHPNKNFYFISSYYNINKMICLTIGYDQNITGPAITITHDLPLDSRAISIIYFDELSLLFINLHTPHDINLKDVIEQTCNKINLSVQPERIIMAGDFNDYQGKLLNNSINIFGKELKIPSDQKIKTCCADTGYLYPGDYFLDSKSENVYFGLPVNYDRNIDLYSDHDPVVLIDL